MAQKSAPCRPNHFKQDAFALRLGEAKNKLCEGNLSTWIVEKFCGEDGTIDAIIKDFGFPPAARVDLLAIPVALDVCLSVPDAQTLLTKKELNPVRAALTKALERMSEIEPRVSTDLRAESGEPLALADGDVVMDQFPGRFPRAREAISDLLDHLHVTEAPMGRKRDYVHWAVLAISSTAKQNQIDLSPAQLTKLADQLIGDVRSRHGHQSRAEYADRGDAPRHQDLVARTLAEKSGTHSPVARQKSPSRKTSPKRG